VPPPLSQPTDDGCWDDLGRPPWIAERRLRCAFSAPVASRSFRGRPCGCAIRVITSGLLLIADELVRHGERTRPIAT